MKEDIDIVNKIWSKAIKNLDAVSHYLTEQWFSKLLPLRLDGNILVLGTPDKYLGDLIEGCSGDILRVSLQNIDGASYEYTIEELTQEKINAFTAKNEIHTSASSLNTPVKSMEFSFDNFIPGITNRHPFAAAQAVAASPGRIYNPLFIYGVNGVGKTHLLHAIAREIRATRPQLSIRSVSCDELLNEFYDLIYKQRSLSEFRSSLRDVDVLLIDDIHNLSKKNAIQEEIFNVYNALYRKCSQIVFTCDRQPGEIDNIDKRLTTRFEQGMICQLNMPEYEERLAILHRWQQNSFLAALPDTILEFLAERISSSVRRLQGCFNRVVSYISIENCKNISIALVEDVLRDQLVAEKSICNIRPEKIQQLVADYYGISQAELIGTSRIRKLAEPRMIAMYLCRKLLNSLSSVELGNAFGRSHANILHADKTITARLADDANLQLDVSKLTRLLQKQ